MGINSRKYGVQAKIASRLIVQCFIVQVIFTGEDLAYDIVIWCTV